MSDRVLSVREKIVHNGLTDDADFGGTLNVRFGKHLATLYAQLADFEIFGTYTIYRGRIVVVSCDELSAGRYIGADGGQEVGFIPQGFIISQLQSLHGRGILTDTATHITARMNHNHIRTHFRNLCLNTFLRALPDGEHGDDGCHTDDDTQHGEEGAKLIVGKGAEGYFEKVCSVHNLYLLVFITLWQRCQSFCR